MLLEINLYTIGQSTQNDWGTDWWLTEEGGFRLGRGCVDQFSFMKNLAEKAWQKKQIVNVGSMDLEKMRD